MKNFIIFTVFFYTSFLTGAQDLYKFNFKIDNLSDSFIKNNSSDNAVILNINFNLIDFTSLYSNLFFLNSENKYEYIGKDALMNLKYLKLDSNKKIKENPFRRAEILFFGSLTFAAFGGWLFLSLFNLLIYDDTFGRLRREQFLILYLGSTVISVGVVLSDIFLYLNPKLKRIKFY